MEFTQGSSFNLDAQKAQVGSIVANLAQQQAKEKARQYQALDSTNDIADLLKENLASEYAKHLLVKVNRFNESLDEQHEVGMQLVSFGTSIQLHVSSIGYINPGMIVFAGMTEDGSKVELIQHISQVNLLLITLPKFKPEEPKRTIGFLQKNQE